LQSGHGNESTVITETGAGAVLAWTLRDDHEGS
jgi:hypothetical protein